MGEKGETDGTHDSQNGVQRFQSENVKRRDHMRGWGGGVKII
jgi:hypothetical protein